MSPVPSGVPPWIKQMVTDQEKTEAPKVPEAVVPAPVTPAIPEPKVEPAAPAAEAPKTTEPLVKPEEMPSSGTLPAEKVEVKTLDTETPVNPGVPDVPPATSPTVPPVSTQLPTSK